MNDHLTLPITSLSYNPSINVWGSSCKDGYIHLYTFPTNKKISSISFYLSQKLSNVDHLFISSSPLASFVIYAKESMCFYSYAINGFFLCKENENDEIHSPRMFSDKNYCDYLLYGTNSGNVVIREFPNMEKIAYIEVAKGKVINCVDISEDKNVIYAYAEVGQEIISIKDPRVMSEVDKLIIWHMGSAFN
jgi:WD40 repeat protein